MIFVGEYNDLKVDRKVDFGYYLTDEDGNDVLLPNASIKERDIKLGEEIEVFIYRDSKDRPIATLKKPLIKVGEVSYLKIVGESSFGAFADIGLDRDIFIPLKEQKFKCLVGKSYLLYAYIDKTGRLAATTYVDNYMEIGEGFKVGDEVEVITYGKGGEKTIRVAIDGKYQGIVLGNEHYNDIYPGEKFKARIKKIYEDGVVGVSTRRKRLEERDVLKEQILDYLEKHDGFMVYNDKTSPEIIKETFNTSKNYFKMTLGGLMKEGKIEQSLEGTRLKK
ncbi:CvfB family protein [Clostridium cibarium]|uniref:DNA-binding protein n=1 Tax=Clostridium cibarium TaxID=2762247 RepID=A0ABR8PT76_9CLOT|nr:S1-like domain-containing RNA-binding protein [Clostridium cibarium]MBD7911376.1 DNA-binding protein [Clostridium cibarium]